MKHFHTMFAFAEAPLIITLETKLTMADAGCSGSSSAKMWHWLSVLLAGFLATNPKQRLEQSFIVVFTGVESEDLEFDFHEFIFHSISDSVNRSYYTAQNGMIINE